MKIILSMFLVVAGASASTPIPPLLPIAPAIKRTEPLRSPRDASQPKATPMQRFSPASEPPLLPMGAFYVDTPGDPFGDHELHAVALQPANQVLIFELSRNELRTWTPLAFWTPYPVDQNVTVVISSSRPNDFIRARAMPPTTPPPGVLAEARRVLFSESGMVLKSKQQRVWTNPEFRVRTSVTPKK